MAKDNNETSPTQNSDGPRLYVVLLRETPVTLRQLGVVRARDADKAIRTFMDYDPKTLVGIPANRWNERKDVCLENEPKANMGESVPVLEGQLAIEAAI